MKRHVEGVHRKSGPQIPTTNDQLQDADANEPRASKDEEMIELETISNEVFEATRTQSYSMQNSPFILSLLKPEPIDIEQENFDQHF